MAYYCGNYNTTAKNPRKSSLKRYSLFIIPPYLESDYEPYKSDAHQMLLSEVLINNVDSKQNYPATIYRFWMALCEKKSHISRVMNSSGRTAIEYFVQDEYDVRHFTKQLRERMSIFI